MAGKFKKECMNFGWHYGFEEGLPVGAGRLPIHP